MHPLTQLILEDMKPALGVTEPGAIAFVAAKARSYAPGELVKLEVHLNSGMYKNAFSCGIPNSELVGNAYAAALGYLAGDAEKGLSALEHVTEVDNRAAYDLVQAGKVQVHMSGVTSEIEIRGVLTTEEHVCEVLVLGKHTNVCKVTLDGQVLFQKDYTPDGEQAGGHDIHAYTLAQLVEYARTVPLEEIACLQDAYTVNMALFEEGLASPRTAILHDFYRQNGEQVLSKDVLQSAQLLCAGAIEARVIGLGKPAMSITGSGSHGIICTMPLYAVCQIEGYSREQLLRATALCYLITISIKEYSGRLSAFCGCGIAAGSGMACALTWLRGGDLKQIGDTLNGMASSITGMICHGGNLGGHRCRLPLFHFGPPRGGSSGGPWHQRLDAGGHHAQHGAYRLPRHGGDRGGHCADYGEQIKRPPFPAGREQSPWEQTCSRRHTPGWSG